MDKLTIEIPKKIYVYNEPINMCKSFNGLGELVSEELEKRPENGDMYVFLNRRWNYIKVYAYQENGQVIYSKRLSNGHFSEALRTRRAISAKELQEIVDAITYDREDSSATYQEGAGA